MRRRRPSPLLVMLALVAAGSVVAAVLVVGGPAPAAAVSRRTVTATRGVVESTVSGSGNLAPKKQLDLRFGTSGTVQRVYVKAGRHVVSGQVLARLDPTAADVQLQQAQAQLADAEDRLQRAEQAAASPTPTPTPSPTAAPRASASASTPSSSASTSSATSVDSARASVASAELAVRQAQDAVTGTVIRAPMAGVVAAVNGAEGDQVSGGGSRSSGSSGFITLVDLHRLTMKVQLSEADIGKVRVGDPATVSVEAVPGEEVAAHVRSIGVLSSSSSSSSQGGGSSGGAVSYPVTLVLDQRAPHVRPGMSASADIVTRRAHGVVVPSQAVTGSTVTVLEDGKPRTRQVQVGVTGDTSTQILSGVKAGEQVEITSVSALAGRAAGSGSPASAKGPAGGRITVGPGFGGSGGPRVRVFGGP